VVVVKDDENVIVIKNRDVFFALSVFVAVWGGTSLSLIREY